MNTAATIASAASPAITPPTTAAVLWDLDFGSVVVELRGVEEEEELCELDDEVADVDPEPDDEPEFRAGAEGEPLLVLDEDVADMRLELDVPEEPEVPEELGGSGTSTVY